MVDLVLPVTRFSIVEVDVGWSISTLAPAPIEKLCQLTMAELVDCLMDSCEADGLEMVTPPDATLPPVGSSCACAVDVKPTSAVDVKSSAINGALVMLKGRGEKAWCCMVMPLELDRAGERETVADRF